MGICVDPLGYCYTLGANRGPMVVTKFTPGGEILFKKRVEGNFEPSGAGLAADDLGNVYITGSFRSSAQFDSIRLDGGSESTLYFGQLYVSNAPPVLPPISPRRVVAGRSLSVTNAAVDPDWNQSLFYSLGPGAPQGTAIEPTTGIFRWRPSEEQAGTTNRIVVRATDNGLPPQTGEQPLIVVVPDLVRLALSNTLIPDGGLGEMPVTVFSSARLTNLTFTLDLATNRFSDISAVSLVPETANASVRRVSDTSFIVSFAATPGQTLSGRMEVAQLKFQTLTNGRSTVVKLVPASITAQRADSSMVSDVRSQSGELLVLGREPILQIGAWERGTASLTVYGAVGVRYRILSSPSLAASLWSEEATVRLTDLSGKISILATGARRFFRAARID